MQYSHTQHGPWHYILYLPILAMLAAAWVCRDERGVMITFVTVGAVLFVVSLMFQSLTVCDEGDALAIRFGPLPVFSKRIPYADITAVEPGQTSILDGWGIHWFPGRGTTYNVWGFGCAKVRVGHRLIRIGSDDVDNLVAFLRTKIDEH